MIERFEIAENATYLPPDAKALMEAERLSAYLVSENSSVIEAALSVANANDQTIIEALKSDPGELLSGLQNLGIGLAGDSVAGVLSNAMSIALPGISGAFTAALALKSPGSTELSADTKTILSAIDDAIIQQNKYIQEESNRVIETLNLTVLNLDKISQIREKMIADAKIDLLQEFSDRVQDYTQQIADEIEQYVTEQIEDAEAEAIEAVSAANAQFAMVAAQISSEIETKISDSISADRIVYLEELLQFENDITIAIADDIPEILAEALWKTQN